MNRKDFIDIISKPVQLKNEHLFDLEEVIHNFPYFQTARVLHLKALKKHKSIRYNENLRTTAAYTSDRSVLFHYITSDDFFYKNEQESNFISEIELIDEKVIDNLNHKESEKNESIIEAENFQKKLPHTPKLIELTGTEESTNLQLDSDLNNQNLITLENTSQSIRDIKKEVNELTPIESNQDTSSLDNDRANQLETEIHDSEKQLKKISFQETETTFKLDLNKEIAPEIKDEEIEIYIDNYSGDLDKEEVRALLVQYKTKSEVKSLDATTFDYKKELFFDITTDEIKEEKTETQSKENIQTINKDNVTATITPKIVEVENPFEPATNPFEFAFEIDDKEAILTISYTEEKNTESQKKETSVFDDLRFEPILENKTTKTKEEKPVLNALIPKKQEASLPISFNKEDKHSFNEWLQLSSFKPIDRTKSTTKKIKKEKNKELIDTFIDNNPKITPIKASATNTLYSLNAEESSDKQMVMTETLAQIYTNQKKYKNAIKAYEVLSLKFPEKSGFFADQIKILKKLKHE